MQVNTDTLSACVSVIALISSIVFFIINWRHTQTLFQQSIISELDFSLGDGTWKMGEPLILKVTNLGKASVRDVIIQLSVTSGFVPLQIQQHPCFILESFSILGNQSENSIYSIDISKYLNCSLLRLGITKRTNETGDKVELAVPISQALPVVTLECEWESGVYQVHSHRTLTRRFVLMQWGELETPLRWGVHKHKPWA
jgi:hypothetical protein